MAYSADHRQEEPDRWPRLLSTSYNEFNPRDLGERFVRFLLDNRQTREFLQKIVSRDRDDADDWNRGGKRGPPPKRPTSIEIDAFRLSSYDPVLANLTLRHPGPMLNLFEDYTVCAQIEVFSDAPSYYSPLPLRPRLSNLPPHRQFCKPSLAAISASDAGSFVQVSGTCVKAGRTLMMETSRVFRCNNGHLCREYADFGRRDNAIVAPTACPYTFDDEEGDVCACTFFTIELELAHRRDYQEIKIQETPSAVDTPGRTPRTLLVKLEGDLVDSCFPGDDVVITGQLNSEWESISLTAGAEMIVGISIKAESVRITDRDEEESASTGDRGRKLTREFERFWSRNASNPIAARDFITRSVCPNLHGMHPAKLGILLVLIGGAGDDGADDDASAVKLANATRKNETGVEPEHGPVPFVVECREGKKQRGESQRRRSRSHILFIGDPGWV